jgi:hypothetical protein
MKKHRRKLYVTALLLLAIPLLNSPKPPSILITPAWADDDGEYNTLVVSPTALTFNYLQGGTLPSAQTLTVKSSTSHAINFTDTTSGVPWLAVSRTSGTTPSYISVSVKPGSLAVGTYTASVTISSNNVYVRVPVTLNITSGTTAGFAVTPASLAFGYQQGGTLPTSQKLSVTDGTTVSFTDVTSGASWLSVSPSSGTTPGSIIVSANPANLATGTYNASVKVTPSTGSALTVPVTLTISTSSGGGGTGTGSYVLLAWAELGMHCVDGKDYSVLSILPPYNTIYAKLIQTGSTPTTITSGVTLTYTAMADSTGSINTTSAGSALAPPTSNTTANTPQKTNFWTYVYSLLHATLNPDIGAKLLPMQNLNPEQMAYGSFVLDGNLQTWKAEGIPLMPYDDKLAAKPYPMAKITATNSSRTVLATTTVVLAVSDEVRCQNCHAANTNSAAMPSGGWVNFSNLSADQNWRLNVLKKHDDLNLGTANWSTALAAVNGKGYSYSSGGLYPTAVNPSTGALTGTPIMCAACHQSNALWAAVGLQGASGALPMTQAMHTLHASQSVPGSSTTLDNMTTAPNLGCYQCHPGPTTQCQRGAMTGTIPGSTAVTCYGCHGNLTTVGSSSREGWLDLPNCQMCHQNGTTYTTAFSSGTTYRASTDTRFATNPNSPPPPPGTTGPYSLYRYSTGHGSVECSGCHGAQHAEYPTSQANDNVSSISLQGYAGRVTECTVCHGSTPPSTGNGGPHGMHIVGSAWVSAHPNYVSSNGGATAAGCGYCHGSTFQGTSLSMILTSKTLAGKTFSAYHQMNCYDCHNGPNGD